MYILDLGGESAVDRGSLSAYSVSFRARLRYRDNNHPLCPVTRARETRLSRAGDNLEVRSAFTA